MFTLLTPLFQNQLITYNNIKMMGLRRDKKEEADDGKNGGHASGKYIYEKCIKTSNMPF